MTYQVTGQWRGREVAVEWDASRGELVGNAQLWAYVKANEGRRFAVYPTGPDFVLNPLLPGHVFFALGNMIGQLRYSGKPPDLPEGVSPADVAVPLDAVP